MPRVPTTIIRMGRCFVCSPSFANDDFGDVEFIVSHFWAILYYNANGAGISATKFIHKINRPNLGIQSLRQT